MDENFAYWSASSYEQENGSLRPTPLVPNFVANITDRLSSEMPCYHDRAICRRPSYFWTTSWAHNPQFHRIETWLSCTPLFLRLFLTLGFLSCYEPPSERWSIPDALNPFLTLGSGINRLPIRLKLPIVPSYFALDVLLSFNSRDTSASFPELFTRWLTL